MIDLLSDADMVVSYDRINQLPQDLSSSVCVHFKKDVVVPTGFTNPSSQQDLLTTLITTPHHLLQRDHSTELESL